MWCNSSKFPKIVELNCIFWAFDQFVTFLISFYRIPKYSYNVIRKRLDDVSSKFYMGFSDWLGKSDIENKIFFSMAFSVTNFLASASYRFSNHQLLPTILIIVLAKTLSNCIRYKFISSISTQDNGRRQVLEVNHWIWRKIINCKYKVWIMDWLS